jgi:hypothetical protein
MIDWREEASRKLESSKLTQEERAEIARELAGYLGDLSDELCGSGADGSSAIARASHELDEDPHLGAHLYRARQEGNMNDRTKQLWLPGITTLLVSGLVGWLLRFALVHFSHPVVRAENGWKIFTQAIMGQDPWLLAYRLWLCALPFIGAAGAYWSRRVGGGRKRQAAAGFLPVLLSVAVLVGGQVAQFQGTMPARFGPFSLSGSFSLDWLSWGIFYPGAALLLGVLPFLLRREENIKERAKRLWLPGLTMVLACVALLASLRLIGLRPLYGLLWFRWPQPSLGPNHWSIWTWMYSPWIFVLPFLGAAGAYWARKAGGDRGVQAAAGLSPVLVFLACFLAMAHAALNENFPPLKRLPGVLAVDVLMWIVVPGAAVFLGVLPFLLASQIAAKSPSRTHTAISA